jgi:glycogen operon protein
MSVTRPEAPVDTGACETRRVRSGTPLPLGAHAHGDGVNFALFSRHATRVYLELYDRAGDGVPAERIALTADRHRTGDIWHVWVQDLAPGQLYGYRLEGPYQPQQGHRYNRHKLLLDPYARAVTRLAGWDFDPARGHDPAVTTDELALSRQDDAAAMPRCVFVHEHFDWAGDQPLRHAWSDTIVYETHVRGFTIHASAGVAHPGSYAGLVEKLPHLRSLGITALELLPVQEFNENAFITGARASALGNYWGYDTVSFLAPKASYSSAGGQGQQVREFKELVRACHRAGIEVILDVVFNHTAEGDERGPTLSFRGIDNVIYYMLDADRRHYLDYTGTGNTLNANHPVVRDFVLDALRYWVLEMHVDGFRFDLASVLGRNGDGDLMADAPLLERIAEDPILRETKIIAEAWDSAGAYQVGSFSERRWAEWNGRFRDDVRRFWRGDDGMLGLFASRLCGSADLYESSGKGPESSINFVTCHDGFTLNDLVSHAHKHNEGNDEGNRDGMAENFSSNYGVEGTTEDPRIEALRTRQIKNFLLTLLVSRGVPMLLGGDEFRRTQRGNNNAWCQDNETGWYDWSLLERHHEIARFTRLMIALRRAHPALSRECYYSEQDIRFFNTAGATPDWSDGSEKRLGIHIRLSGEPELCLLFNAGIEAAGFPLPVSPRDRCWRLAADTARAPPQDICRPGEEPGLGNRHAYRLEPRTSAILVAC